MNLFGFSFLREDHLLSVFSRSLFKGGSLGSLFLSVCSSSEFDSFHDDSNPLGLTLFPFGQSSLVVFGFFDSHGMSLLGSLLGKSLFGLILLNLEGSDNLRHLLAGVLISTLVAAVSDVPDKRTDAAFDLLDDFILFSHDEGDLSLLCDRFLRTWLLGKGGSKGTGCLLLGKGGFNFPDSSSNFTGFLTFLGRSSLGHFLFMCGRHFLDMSEQPFVLGMSVFGGSSSHHSFLFISGLEFGNNLFVFNVSRDIFLFISC